MMLRMGPRKKQHFKISWKVSKIRKKSRNTQHWITENKLPLGTQVYTKTIGLHDKLHPRYKGPFTIVVHTDIFIKWTNEWHLPTSKTKSFLLCLLWNCIICKLFFIYLFIYLYSKTKMLGIYKWLLKTELLIAIALTTFLLLFFFNAVFF